MIATLEDAYGVSIDGEDLAEASNVYLNASESDIEDLLYAASGEDELDDVMSASAYDFGFYTQVKATKEGAVKHSSTLPLITTKVLGRFPTMHQRASKWITTQCPMVTAPPQSVAWDLTL